MGLFRLKQEISLTVMGRAMKKFGNMTISFVRRGKGAASSRLEEDNIKQENHMEYSFECERNRYLTHWEGIGERGLILIVETPNSLPFERILKALGDAISNDWKRAKSCAC